MTITDNGGSFMPLTAEQIRECEKRTAAADAAHAPPPPKTRRRTAKPDGPILTIVEDTREQNPLDFSPYEKYGILAVRKKLQTGDYSVLGWESHVFIERKSLNDLVSTLTFGRDRFLREVYDRGTFVPCKHLVVEATWQEISSPYPFAPGANPLAIVNSLFSLMMPPAQCHVFVGRRAMCTWYIVNAAANFVRRVTHGSRGLWNAVNAPNAADLPPIPIPYRSISE